MKRFLRFAVVILIILPVVFSGCKDPELENMVFVDNLSNPAKEFIIYEDCTFKVTFIKTYEMEGLQLPVDLSAGRTVNGKVNTSNGWKDSVINGTAVEMTSNDNTLAMILAAPEVDGMKIKLTYGSEMASIKVEFPDSTDSVSDYQSMAIVSNLMMGGTYYKK